MENKLIKSAFEKCKGSVMNRIYYAFSDAKKANYFKGKYFYPLKSSQIKLPATIKTSNDIAARQYYDSNKYVKLL